MSTRYLRLLAATVVIVTAIWLFMNFGPELPEPPPKKKIANTPEENPEPHINAILPGQGSPLKPHGIENIHPDADVSTIRLHTNWTDGPVPLVQEETTATLPRFAKVDGDDFGLAPYSWRVTVNVPRPPPTRDASTMVFGIASTLPRLDDSLLQIQHWSAFTGAKIIVVIDYNDDKKDLTVDGMTEKARDMAIDLEIVERTADFNDRYLLLVKVLHQFMTPQTRWVGLLDDDTFFPSITRLVKALSKYNYKEQHYVGGLTEDIEAIPKWGYMAFGGAGIMLSRGLLDKLQGKYDECHKLPASAGDGRLAECIYKFTITKFTWEKGLMQFDMFGDYSGIFEAVRPLPISVHHWKSWGHHDMVLASQITRICSDNCIFMKLQLADGWFMTHGFSIVKYSEKGKGTFDDGSKKEILHHLDGSMERTWKKVADETPLKYLHSLSPLRPKDEGKRSYLLEAAVEEDEHAMTLYYVKREAEKAVGIIRVIFTKD